MRRSAPPSLDYAGLDDPVFDVNVTPNRQDCMGVRGIARDLAAAGHRHAEAARRAADRRQLPLPGADPDRGSGGLPGLLRPSDPRREERRLARVDAAPAQGRGAAADLGAGRHHQLRDARPRPAGHAYDIAKLTRRPDRPARRATGEKVLALNEKEYALEPFMTVIADDAQVHDIGGIMGGEDSGVSDDDDRRDARGRLFHAGADRADRPGARPHQRRPQPLRAWRRSRVPRRRPGDPHRPDPRHLRRRAVGG